MPSPVIRYWIPICIKFDAIQYIDRPLGNVNDRNSSIIGIIQSIIWLVCACRASADGIIVIFWTAHIEPPTNIGIIGVLSGSAKSNHRKLLSKGTASLTIGSQKYSFCDSPTRDSGLVGRICIIAWYNPIQIGICMNMGPRQPRGLTPFSRYILIVSWDTLPRSLGYFCCISRINGWILDIALVIRICFSVIGRVITLIITVKISMLIPKLSPNSLYMTISPFIIGSCITVFQIVPITSKITTLFAIIRFVFGVVAPGFYPETIFKVCQSDLVIVSAYNNFVYLRCDIGSHVIISIK